MNKKVKEEVYKCSKCGLCKSVCPIYTATRNEVFSPRGRYIVLNNYFNNNKKLSKKSIKNLDFCLNCNLCKDFCPSNIDSTLIFNSIKKVSKIFYIKLYYFFIKNKILNKKKEVKPNKYTGRNKIIYFEGCFNKYVDPSDKNSTINILENFGFEVEIISNCCGYPYFNNGHTKEFEKISKKNINLCNSDAKYIVCSCDSCYETLNKINNKEFNEKLIRLDELIDTIETNKEGKDNNALYFKPLIRKKNCYLENNIQSINKKGFCSFMENFFMIKYPRHTKEIINKQNIEVNEINNKIIITTCQLTKFGLKKYIKTTNANAEVLSLSEYVNLIDNKKRSSTEQK